ncbi:hypothetical protein PAXRUDRAFT_780311 [Paxillus rubicundulus Ve08.2h10]|uniref:Uncharacterized protein n=1 Tax=Paxillus rubicundulus Ve08.2h10 TaxID=930991 RepID=A0A0D0C0D8_9AGAM|nr:hypothetical protein PAXRUDRAFT_780311 [Paxillus rubicundulus Ve08.2h10]
MKGAVRAFTRHLPSSRDWHAANKATYMIGRLTQRMVLATENFSFLSSDAVRRLYRFTTLATRNAHLPFVLSTSSRSVCLEGTRVPSVVMSTSSQSSKNANHAMPA